jgi:hypothetical protein
MMMVMVMIVVDMEMWKRQYYILKTTAPFAME